jgi:hypothetical protein
MGLKLWGNFDAVPTLIFGRLLYGYVFNIVPTYSEKTYFAIKNWPHEIFWFQLLDLKVPPLLEHVSSLLKFKMLSAVNIMLCYDAISYHWFNESLAIEYRISKFTEVAEYWRWNSWSKCALESVHHTGIYTEYPYGRGERREDKYEGTCL